MVLLLSLSPHVRGHEQCNFPVLVADDVELVALFRMQCCHCSTDCQHGGGRDRRGGQRRLRVSLLSWHHLLHVPSQVGSEVLGRDGPSQSLASWNHGKASCIWSRSTHIVMCMVVSLQPLCSLLSLVLATS